MTLPSIRLLADAVVALLVAAPMTVHKSRVQPALTLDHDGLVKGHAILHPGGPATGHLSLDARPDSVLWGFQVDCVGGTHDYVLGVADQVVAALDGKTLTVAGARVGLIQPPFGFQPPAAFRDPDARPFQLRIPLLYQVLAVPA